MFNAYIKKVYKLIELQLSKVFYQQKEIEIKLLS